MDAQPINKEVNEEDLQLIYKSIIELNKKMNDLGFEIFKNETDKGLLAKPSQFTFSIIHRAIELNRGFISLTEANNWVTAINLLRLQADNCMRLFALSLVKDRLDFYNRVLNGEKIKKIKDAKGNKMDDSYLSNKLNGLFPGFQTLYDNASGFIHFSNEHLDLNTDIVEMEDSFLMYIRLAETTELAIYKKVDYAFNMLQVGEELFELLKGYKLMMENIMRKIKPDKGSE